MPDNDTQAILARREALIKQLLSEEEMEQIQGGVDITGVLRPCLTIISNPRPCLTIIRDPQICLSIIPPQIESELG